MFDLFFKSAFHPEKNNVYIHFRGGLYFLKTQKEPMYEVSEWIPVPFSLGQHWQSTQFFSNLTLLSVG